VTARDKIEAEEHKQERYCKAHGKCSVCGKSITYSECQLAHRIPKGYASVYGPEVIHHDINTPLTCAKCNDSVLLTPAANPVEAKKLIEKIKENIDGR